MSTPVQPELHVCPDCGTANELDTLAKREYRCSQCNLELAHLDVAANGVTRGIFGWLRGVGDTIENRYQVKSVLGKGGFGATYLVEDLRLSGKRRAIKEVPELLFDEYETTLLSRLNHPSIPDIIDRNVVDGMVYLVLEFGGTKTLGSERKQHGRIPVENLVPWMRQLCEVLIYLHSQNPPIIHRDLKPDNILLDENGRIMLIDFGIAKESTPATMTRTIGRAATHGFSPPEQAMGTGTDERSDIYALAATFYALLTGENPPAAHERVAGKELVPPSQLVPELSTSLESALLRALNLNVNLRQQTVKEFSLALATTDSGLSGSATQSTPYTDRTVLISKRTNATGLHPHSLKLPSGRIDPVKPAATSESSSAPVSQKISRRNAILLIPGITVVFVAILTTTYLLWPKTGPETEKTVSPPLTEQKPIIDNSAGPSVPAKIGRSDKPPTDGSTSDIKPTEGQNQPINVGKVDAITALQQSLIKQGGQPKSPPKVEVKPDRPPKIVKVNPPPIKKYSKKKKWEDELADSITIVK